MPPSLPSGRASLPPQATRFLQRARILDATARAVAQAGYGATTVRDIQTRAGVSKRTFYEHFDNKQDAVLWAQDAAASYAVPRVVRALRAQDGWADGVSAALDTYLRLLDCEPDWAALYLVELPMLGGEVLARREALLAPLLAALRARLPRDDGPLSLPTVLAAVDGVLRAGIAGRPATGLASLRPQLVYLALAPYVEPARARDRAAAAPPGGAGAGSGGASGAAGRGARIAQLCERLDDGRALDELRGLIGAAAADGDGPALWRAITAFHRRRGEGRTVPVALERRALRGLEGATFFGLALRGETPGGAAAPAPRPRPAQRILEHLAEHPGASGEDVRRALGFRHLSQVSRLLAALERDGLAIRDAGRGRANAWRVADGAPSAPSAAAKEDDA